jgi:putative membrane protein
LIIISLPLVLFSLGLFLLIINGIIFYCLQDFVPGFHVSSFLGALVGSILLSVITWIFGQLGRKERQEKVRTTQTYRDRDEVIDI